MKEMEYTGYLFCYFTGKEETLMDEQVYFAVSRDGLRWKDLNQGRPFLQSSIGEGGVRDPFLLRMKDQKKYVILATDLQIAKGTDWESAVQKGSTQIVCWESEDMVHWSEPYFFDTKVENAGCAWAPEAVYDETNGNYMVFWAAMTGEEGCRKHRIYYSTTEDFHHFSSPRIWIERENDVIDTTIIWNNGYYYRFSKDEHSKKLIVEKGENLQEGPYVPVRSDLLENLSGVEGPAVFQFIGEEKWCLLVDRYRESKGYMPLITDNLDCGEFTIIPETDYSFGTKKKRHGSVMYLTEEEWQRLEAYENALPVTDAEKEKTAVN